MNTDPVSGEQSLRDATQVTKDLTFDSIRGGIARSDGLFVSIVPVWED